MSRSTTDRGLLFLLVLTLIPGCKKPAPPPQRHPAPSVAVSSTSVTKTSTTNTAAEPPLQPPAEADPISQGLWWLYNQQYDKARAIFAARAAATPKDPQGPFYEAATDWWQLAQTFDVAQPALEKRFAADTKETVRRAQAVLRNKPKTTVAAQAHLCWGGARGLEGRWLVAQSQWMKAYAAGKDGHKHLEKAVALDPQLDDAYLGLGIYDYYTDVLPGFMGAMSKLVMRGNSKRGLQELQRALAKGEHARTEARVFLIEIYTDEQHHPEKALPIAQALHQEFPRSPVMHLGLIHVLNEMHRWPEMKTEARRYLTNAEQKTPFYTPMDLLVGRYVLGLALLMGEQKTHDSRALFNQVIADSTQAKSRWVTFAYLRRAQAYDLDHARVQAKADYQRVLKRPNIWDSHLEAHRGLKGPFKK